MKDDSCLHSAEYFLATTCLKKTAYQFVCNFMPVYEFQCPSDQCETYEVWRRIDQRTIDTNCPSCGKEGKRVFSPPMTLSSSLRLKVERKEPQMVRRTNQESKRPQLRQNNSRPWMLNRGC